MGVAKRDIGDGNLVANLMRGRHGDGFVGERRTADGAKSLIADDEFFPDVEAIANCEERLALTILGALSIAYVQGSGRVVAGGEGGADAGVHSSAEQDHGGLG